MIGYWDSGTLERAIRLDARSASVGVRVCEAGAEVGLGLGIGFVGRACSELCVSG